MDFFDPKYVTEPPRNEALFGLVDDGFLARSTTKDETNWVAVVKNRKGKSVQFVPVDHNIRIIEELEHIPFEYYPAFLDLKKSIENNCIKDPNVFSGNSIVRV